MAPLWLNAITNQLKPRRWIEWNRMEWYWLIYDVHRCSSLPLGWFGEWRMPRRQWPARINFPFCDLFHANWFTGWSSRAMATTRNTDTLRWRRDALTTGASRPSPTSAWRPCRRRPPTSTPACRCTMNWNRRTSPLILDINHRLTWMTPSPPH